MAESEKFEINCKNNNPSTPTESLSRWSSSNTERSHNVNPRDQPHQAAEEEELRLRCKAQYGEKHRLNF